MFRLAHSTYLYLFLLIPAFTVLFILFMLWRKKALQRFGENSFVMKLIPDYSAGKFVLKFILLMAGVGFLIFAIVDPQSGSKLEKVQRKGIDLMIALDVSNSMLAQDISPNRLDRAKQAISKLIDQLDGDRIGIVIFAGKAYTQLPITTDYAAAKLFLSSISTNSVSVQGTAIGEAIEFSVNSFGQSKANKAIIIITDGEDHEGDVVEQAENAARKGITIYTIGMGLPDGAPIPVMNGTVQTGFKKDKEGTVVVSRLDETLLQQIAAAGKGIYSRANNSEVGLQKVMDDMSKIQKSELDNRQYSDYEDLFQYFLAAGLILLVLELFVFDKKNAWFGKFRIFEKGTAVNGK